MLAGGEEATALRELSNHSPQPTWTCVADPDSRLDVSLKFSVHGSPLVPTDRSARPPRPQSHVSLQT